MRFIVCFIALMMISGPAFAQQPWYEGGTLQKGTVADWKQATAANQLATSADFVASLAGVSDISKVQDPVTLADIRKRSEYLQACINESVAKPVPPDRPVAEVVVRAARF